MLFHTGWLAEHVTVPESIDELAERLTAVGMAVEGRERAADGAWVLDVDVTTNRPDAMCHRGLARELAAATGTRVLSLETAADHPASPATVVVELSDPGCRRYVARVVRGVAIGPSPDWLRERLAAIGQRSINNVVDLTNYVLWETGQPLHAFDLAKLAGGKIVVRRARAGERLRTLDGEDRELATDDLVIADAERAVALAGVMGGEESEVGEGTTDLLLESAWFEPATVRRTARAQGLHTDASHRFERGADPEGCLPAADRFLHLLLALQEGRSLGVEEAVVATGEPLPAPAVIPLALAEVSRFAGAELAVEDVEIPLAALGFALAREDGDDGPRWRVTVPSWRRFEVLEAADLYEEVLRTYGYDRIPATLPAVGGPDAPATPGQVRRRRIRDRLVAAGFVEAVDYAFYSRDEDRVFAPARDEVGDALELVNPLSERYALLRRSLLPGLVASAGFNRRRQAASVRLFELGHVFWRAADGSPREAEHLALVAGGSPRTPWGGGGELDFFALKGVVEELAVAAGARLVAEPAELPGLVPGATAVLRDGEGRRVGHLGQVAEDPETFPLYAAEIAIDLLPAVTAAVRVELPSRFPAVEVDTTLTHPVTVSWGAVADAIAGAAPSELRRFYLKDRYAGPGVPAGCVNTTIGFEYRSPERSLTQEEVNARQEALAGLLAERFGAAGVPS